MYEGRGWNVQGAHTAGFNSRGYGTCFIGDFTDAVPTQAAINAYMALLQVIFKFYKSRNLLLCWM